MSLKVNLHNLFHFPQPTPHISVSSWPFVSSHQICNTLMLLVLQIFEFSTPIQNVWGEIFCTHPDQPWGPLSLLYTGYWVSVLGVKWPGHGIDPPNECQSYSPSVPSWPVARWTSPLPLLTVPNFVCLTNVKLVLHAHKLVGELRIGIWLSHGNPTQIKEVSEVGRDEDGINTRGFFQYLHQAWPNI
jgi:hypothetical protein